MWAAFLLAIGIPLVVLGADLLVRGASGLAVAAHISPLVIGLTLVAFGTSAPEIAISVDAAARGFGDVALGNAIGSNIFNVLFVLGLSAVAAPLIISGQIIRRDAPLMVIASVVVYVMALDGNLGLIDGLILLAALFSYLAMSFYAGRKVVTSHEETAEAADSDEGVPLPGVGKVPPVPPPSNAFDLLKYAVLLVVGLALLVVGARVLVNGAVDLARTLGVSDLVISLTIVAAGTSLPEGATSIVAALRNERDIAVGNVVGSNIWNILAVLGAGAVVAPQGIIVDPSALRFDLVVMVAVSAVCLPIFYVSRRVSRLEGGILFAYYLLYTSYVVLTASGSTAQAAQLGYLITRFIVPATVVVLAARVIWAFVQRLQAARRA